MNRHIRRMRSMRRERLFLALQMTPIMVVLFLLFEVAELVEVGLDVELAVD